MRINTVFVCCLLVVLYFIVPIIMMFTKDDKMYRLIRNLVLSSFFVVLLIGVIGDIDYTKEKIYIGFDWLGVSCGKEVLWGVNKFKPDIYINLLMLVPLGMILFVQDKKNKKKFSIFKPLFVGFFIGVVIEFLQFILPIRRSVQLQDAVCNSVSFLLGYCFMFLVYMFVVLVKKEKIKFDK